MNILENEWQLQDDQRNSWLVTNQSEYTVFVHLVLALEFETNNCESNLFEL